MILDARIADRGGWLPQSSKHLYDLDPFPSGTNFSRFASRSPSYVIHGINNPLTRYPRYDKLMNPMDISKGFTIRGGQSVSDLVNYKDYLHIFNHTTQTYDLVHKGTGVVLKANQPMPARRAHTEYDPLIADMIVDRLLNGIRLSAIVSEQGMPSAGVIAVWLKHNPMFKANVEMAREYAAEIYHDKVLDIADLAMNADKSEVPGLKLAADSYKWAAEKGSERFAKRKEEGNNGSASITINLRTGVHEARIAEDLIVDEYGNFKGFKDGSSESWECEEPQQVRSIEDIELGKERYKIVDGKEADEEA